MLFLSMSNSMPQWDWILLRRLLPMTAKKSQSMTRPSENSYLITSVGDKKSKMVDKKWKTIVAPLKSLVLPRGKSQECSLWKKALSSTMKSIKKDSFVRMKKICELAGTIALTALIYSTFSSSSAMIGRTVKSQKRSHNFWETST